MRSTKGSQLSAGAYPCQAWDIKTGNARITSTIDRTMCIHNRGLIGKRGVRIEVLSAHIRYAILGIDPPLPCTPTLVAFNGPLSSTLDNAKP